jgi:sRNA-binding regulator protein Hfq
MANQTLEKETSKLSCSIILHILMINEMGKQQLLYKHAISTIHLG